MGLVVVTLLASMLTACQPAPLPILAVAWVGGESGGPGIVIQVCPDSVVLSVSVIESTGTKQWEVEAENSRTRIEFEMFAVPPGWRLTDSSLGAIEPGVDYTVSLLTRQLPYVLLSFEVADLEGLESDEVWTINPNGTGAKAVMR